MEPADSPLHEKLLFNVGAQRSGTFWLQRMITAHPAVSAIPGESSLFSHGIAPLFERFSQGARDTALVGLLYVERQRLLMATRQFCDAVLVPHLETGARFLSERTPFHVKHMNLIAEIYPDAHFIHIIRDGRDVARSVVAQPWGPETVEEAATEWVACIEASRRADLPAERYREVRYETLLERPGEELAGIFEWLGLDASDDELAQSLVESGRMKNVDRYGKGGVATGKWQETFSDGDLAAFERVAGETRETLGYPRAPGGRTKAGRLPGGLRPLALRGRLRRDKRKPDISMTPAQRLLVADRAISHLRPGGATALKALTAQSFTLRIVDARDDAVLRGEQARDELEPMIARDDAWSGRQTMGHVYPGGATIGYVLRFEVGGEERNRVVFVTAQGGKVTELAVYAGLSL